MRSELGNPDRRFVRIEEKPIAAASLGQAHRAWLPPETESHELGKAVVIKVQRPNIEQMVRTDLSALRVVAKWLMRYPPIRLRADVPALLEEFSNCLIREGFLIRMICRNLHWVMSYESLIFLLGLPQG